MTSNIHFDDQSNLIIEIAFVNSEINKIDFDVSEKEKQIKQLHLQIKNLSERGNKGAVIGGILLGITGVGIGIGIGAGLGHLYDKWKYSSTTEEREIKKNQLKQKINVLNVEIERRIQVTSDARGGG
jgi:hypothetical protein